MAKVKHRAVLLGGLCVAAIAAAGLINKASKNVMPKTLYSVDNETGEFIYFDYQYARRPYQSLARMDIDGTNFKRLTNGGHPARVPELCPTERLIVYISYERGNPDIKLMQLDGSEKQLLTTHEADDGYPRFSQDCKTVSFFSNRDGNYDIYSITTQSPFSLKRLTQTPYNEHDPVFSPDGKTIAYSSDQNGDNDIISMDLTTGQTELLTQKAGNNIHPAFNMDGSKMVFRSDRSGKFELFLLDLQTGAPARQLTDTQGSLRHPSFGPKGENIIFHTVYGRGKAAIGRVPITGGEVEYLTPSHAAHLNAVWAYIPPK